MIRNILEYLERSADAFGDKAAFVDEENALTFSQVEDRAKRIGTALAIQGQDKKPVAVFMRKSASAVTAFFGAVYSGRCYSPIDSQMPLRRVEQILETLDTDYVIVDSAGKEQLEKTGFQGKVFLYEQLLSTEIDNTLLSSIRDRMIDTDPLYIIFTSGSTGKPKGVVLGHRSVIDLAEWLGDTFAFDSRTVFGNQTPFYFDASVKDLYSTIRNAATMYIIPQQLFGFTRKLFDFLNEKQINTIMWATSAMCMSDGDKAFEACKPEYLNTIIFAGEAMPIHHLNIWRKHLPDAKYVNLYGPTEAAVDSSYYVVDREFEESESLPIGIHCRNMELLILNGDRPVAGSEIGEICIRGTALACGYYRDPEKTNEVFVQNPLQTAYPEKIYRTGDMGYYNERGEIMFVAREDDQIKHRGYRIELGEVEAALNSIPGITRCCCLFDSVTDRILCVYTGDATKKAIILEIGKLIPKYMWPNTFIQLEEMPYNLNGKIDRAALKAEYLSHGKD